MVKLSRNVTDVTLFLMTDPTWQKSHHLNILHNHRKQKEKVFLCDKQIHAAISKCELRAGGLLSQPLMIVGEPEVTQLRHTELPLATGSGLRSTEGEEGVKGQEDAGKSAAGCSTFLLFYQCFLDVWSAGDHSKPSNNGRNHHTVYSVGLMFAVLRSLRRVLLSSLCLQSPVSVFKCFVISSRMAQWGTLMTWLRSILSITAPPSVTCVREWRRYENAK